MKSIIKWCSSIMMATIFIQSIFARNDGRLFSGKSILAPFTNYKTGVGHYSEGNGFNFDRALVGYEGFFTKGFSAKILMDMRTTADENESTKFNEYLKNAQIDWKGKGFFVSAGLVSLKQLSEQENFWGRRYIFRSFQKEHGIAFCENIGIMAGHEFSPVISTDMALTDGEGRKFKNMDNNCKYGAGLTLKPVKGFMFRLYGDIYNTPGYMKSVSGNQKDQYSITAFMGYSHSRFSFDTECSHAFNYEFSPKTDVDGYSAYTTTKTNSKIHLYGRFDLLGAIGENQNTAKEEHTTIGDFEYAPTKQVRISPSYQSWKAKSGERGNYLLMSAGCKI